MNLSRVKVSALISIAMLAAAGQASSGESHDRFRHAARHHEQAVIGSAGLPSVVPGIGTFVGSISAVRIKGNGVFVAVNRSPRPQAVVYRAPKSRIIEVSAENPDDACRFESGVCVIRLKR